MIKIRTCACSIQIYERSCHMCMAIKTHLIFLLCRQQPTQETDICTHKIAESGCLCSILIIRTAIMMLVLSLFTLLTLTQTTHANLDFVYSVQRHGARNVLPKSALLTETDANGGPTLLPQGERQTFLAGECNAVVHMLSIILSWSIDHSVLVTCLSHMNVQQAERRINCHRVAICKCSCCPQVA